MRALALVALASPFVAECFHPAPPPDVGAARAYDRFPLYWVGEEFEGLPLVHVDARPESDIVAFVYGDCDPPPEGGCSPPLQIQIMALCPHLEIVRLPESGNGRAIRRSRGPGGRWAGPPHERGSDPGVLGRRGGRGHRASCPGGAPVGQRRRAGRRGDDPFEPAPSAVLTGERSCA